ncbi:TetR/AcrR family transcriptional regulator [Pseudoxanthomonas jiangsuensis]|uniref:TetR/AcrR family transcriptional regulator n=1 Tax=Pseudoxanthomonas jiangsuensis TaxID=619688 RepID=UPI001FE7F55A|nr:TetR family transcriptional regulator [Pseudoxanthomonas jiangsuensis]
MAVLALAMIRQPRASLQELARSAGISKATLYRFSRTREQLYEVLLAHAQQVVTSALRDAALESAAPRKALEKLTKNALEHRELSVFLVHEWKISTVRGSVESAWEQALDAFFLRGQQLGVFRVDVPAPALTEIYVASLSGIIDAEYRGRVARVGMQCLIDNMFFEGALKR